MKIELSEYEIKQILKVLDEAKYKSKDEYMFDKYEEIIKEIKKQTNFK